MPLMPEQREALIDALIENWRDANMHKIDDVIDSILLFGWTGLSEMTDESLIVHAEVYGLRERMDELGIKEE